MRAAAAALLLAGCSTSPSSAIDTGPLQDALAGTPRPTTEAIAARLPPVLVERLSGVLWNSAFLENPDVQEALDLGGAALDTLDSADGGAGASSGGQSRKSARRAIPVPCDCNDVLKIMDETVTAGSATLVDYSRKIEPDADGLLPGCRWVIKGKFSLCEAGGIDILLSEERKRCAGVPWSSLAGVARGCRACSGSGCRLVGASCAGGAQCCSGLTCDNKQRCGRPTEAVPMMCKAAAGLCGVDSECCSGECQPLGTCASSPLGSACNTDFDCASLFCSGGACSCIATCSGCAIDAECCSGKCNTGNFQCQP